MPFKSSRGVGVTREGSVDKGEKRASLKLSFCAEGWEMRRTQQKRLRRSSWGGGAGVGEYRVLGAGRGPLDLAGWSPFPGWVGQGRSHSSGRFAGKGNVFASCCCCNSYKLNGLKGTEDEIKANQTKSHTEMYSLTALKARGLKSVSSGRNKTGHPDTGGGSFLPLPASAGPRLVTNITPVRLHMAFPPVSVCLSPSLF